MVGITLLAHLSIPDELTSQRGETLLKHLNYRRLAIGKPHDTVLDDNLGRVYPMETRGHFA